MAKAKKKKELSLEEKLEQALVPVDEQPYEVPENWCWTYLENICEYMRAGGDKPKIFVDVETEEYHVPIVANGIQNEGIIGYTDAEGEKAGTVTVSGRGTIGYSIYRDYSYYPVVRLIVLSPQRICVNGKYLKYIFDCLEEEGTGSSIPQLTVPSIKKKQIPLPPLAEQQRIVEQIESLFTKLDEAKEQVQSVLDNSEERRSAILFKAYSGALTKEWRKQNGKSQDEWKEVCLKDVCKINPPKINAKEYDDDMDVSFFPMPALSEVTGTITEPQTRKLGEVKTGFTNFSEGDVVFAKITPCMENGKSAIIPKLVNDIGYGTTEFYVMRCSYRLLNGYLYHLVRSKHFRDEAKSVMTGAVGQQRVPKSFLEEYELKLPSIEEQEEILRIIDGMVCKEHQVALNCENVIEQIDMMKKSILARAFRGELGTNNPDEESAVNLLKQIIAEDL